jgi:hypothetical protein
MDNVVNIWLKYFFVVNFFNISYLNLQENKNSNNVSCNGSDECDTANGLTCQGAIGSQKCR